MSEVSREWDIICIPHKRGLRICLKKTELLGWSKKIYIKIVTQTCCIYWGYEIFHTKMHKLVWCKNIWDSVIKLNSNFENKNVILSGFSNLGHKHLSLFEFEICRLKPQGHHGQFDTWIYSYCIYIMPGSCYIFISGTVGSQCICTKAPSIMFHIHI